MIRLTDVSDVTYSQIYPYVVEATNNDGIFPNEMYNTSFGSRRRSDKTTRFYFFREEQLLQFALRWAGYTG